jgi:hypothetical protein
VGGKDGPWWGEGGGDVMEAGNEDWGVVLGQKQQGGGSGGRQWGGGWRRQDA